MSNSRTNPPVVAIGGHPNAIAWNRNGTCIAVTDADACVWLIDGARSQPVRLQALHTGAIAPRGEDGFLVATDQGAWYLGPGADPGLAGPDPAGWVEAVASHRVGGEAFAAGRSLHWMTSSELLVLPGLPSTVSGIAFSPQGTAVAACHYNGVTILDARAGAGQTPVSLTYAGSHLDVSWSPDGAHVATSTQEKELHVWRLRDGSDMRMSGYHLKVRHLSWSRDARWLVTSGADAAIAWDFAGAGPKGKPPRMVGPFTETLVTAVACDPSGDRVAIGCGDGRVVLAALADSGHDITLWESAGASITALAWSGDGSNLAASRSDGAVAIVAAPPAQRR